MTTRLDNQGCISVLIDPEGTVSALLDPSGIGPCRPTLRVWEPSCLTLRTRALSHPTPRARPLRHPAGSAPPPTTMGPSVWAWVMPLTPERARVRLNMSYGHDRPRPGVRIANSNGCMGTVLPNPGTTADKHVGSPCHPLGWDGTP